MATTASGSRSQSSGGGPETNPKGAMAKLDGMSEGQIESMLRQAQEKEDFKMTEAEAEQFGKAFKDPKFRAMFAEYVEDISDPKYREEQNAYIREMERKGETPAGKKLVHPEAGFVVKTHKSTGEKVFVNMVASVEVDAPSSEAKPGGSDWRLPHILGPPRMERDKKGDTVATFDVCFHPNCVAQATRSKPFRDMVTRIAFDAVEKSYASHGAGEKLQREYHVLRGVDYKTGEPRALMVADTSVPDSSEGEKNPPEPQMSKKKTSRRGGKKKKKSLASDDGSQAAAEAVDADTAATTEKTTPTRENQQQQQDSRDAANLAKAGAVIKNDSLPKNGEKKKPSSGGLAAALRGKLASSKHKKHTEPTEVSAQSSKTIHRDAPRAPRGGAVPAFSIKERSNFEMAEFVGDSKLVRPRQLVVLFELPGHSTSRGVDVDFDDQGLELILTVRDERDAVVYSVDVHLRYPVLKDNAKAKFSTGKQTLEIVVDVEPLPASSDESKVVAAADAEPKVVDVDADESKVVDAADESKDVVADSLESPDTSPKKQEETPPESQKNPDVAALGDATNKERQKAHSRWLDDDDKSQAARKPFARDAPLPAAPSPKATAAATPSSPMKNGESTTAADEKDPDFTAAEAFDGAVPGRAFKLGPKGLGYYKDATPCRVEWRQQPETLTLVIDVADATRVRLDHVSTKKTTVTIFRHPDVLAAFAVTTFADVDRDNCRSDPAEDNCVVVLAKAVRALWPASNAVTFDAGALAVGYGARDPSASPEPPVSAQDHNPGRRPQVGRDPPPLHTTKKPITDLPTTFKNTLLFEID